MPTKRKIRPLKRAVIKEEYIAITGEMLEAVILNQMIYWSERIYDFDSFISEEKNRQAQNNKKVSDFPLLCGWIYKSAEDLKSEIMCTDSARTMNRKLDDLVALGFLDRRRNPNLPYDHRYQYRVNFINVLAALKEQGYTLDGYRVSFDDPEDEPPKMPDPSYKSNQKVSVHSKRQIVKSTVPDISCDESICQNVASDGQIVALERHSVETIPEIISENTVETISSPSIPLGEDNSAKKTRKTESLDSVLDAIGLDRMKHADMSKQIRDILTDLWVTRKVGKSVILARTIIETLQSLTPEMLDNVIDTFAKQTRTQMISAPVEYLKAAIINAPKNNALMVKTKTPGLIGSGRVESYDIDEYTRLSMERLMIEQ